MKILVVDDDVNMRTLAQYNLEKLGHTVLLAETVETAVVLARREKPRLILQDVMLPGMDGIQALAEYRRDPGTRHIPVVMVTARSQRADVEKAMAEGASAYVTKPFDPDRFSEIIARFC